jgi:uncharacterized delta-60 repeat protein
MKKRYSVRTIILAGSLLLQLNTLCFYSRGAPGDVDLSFDTGFGINGWVNDDYPFTVVNALVAQPDGKIIIGGSFTTIKGLVRTNIARLNADGSGDSSFVSAPMNYRVSSLALQSDGKVLVGSSGEDIDGPTVALIRLNSDGSPDTNFNANADAAMGPAIINSIVVQPDGKILYTPWAMNGNSYSVVRLNSNGTRDTNFTLVWGSVWSMALQADGKVIASVNYNGSSNGLVRFNPNGGIDNTFNTAAGNNVPLYSIVLQPDGKVLIGGYPFSVNGTNITPVARLNANGSLDATFNQGTGAGSRVLCMALQPDGKVIIGGQFVSINGQSHTNLARLNSDGSLDSSFNPVVGPLVGSLSSIVLQSDGKVLIGGSFTTVNGTHRSCMARLHSDGSLDVAFQPGQGVGPILSPVFLVDGTQLGPVPISSLVVQPDGKVLVGGVFTFINGTNRYASVRLNADGSRDETFIAATNFNPDLLALRRNDDCPAGSYGCDPVARAFTVAVQADGKVLIGGVMLTIVYYQDVTYYYYRAILGRFYADGSLDTNFAPVFGGPDDYPFRRVGTVIVQPDGKILVAGDFPSVNGTNTYGLARLNANGSLDTTFNPAVGGYPIALQPDGKVLVGGYARLNADGSLDGSFNPGTGANGIVASIIARSDGKVIIGGNFTTVNGTNRNRIARLNANGSLDSSFNPGTGADGIVRSIALQSDGNVLLGGDFFTVNGVWRPYVARLYGDFVAPSLNIARSNAFVIVSWPVTGLNFQLQESTNLFPAVWSPVAQAAVTNAGQISVTVPTTGGRKFFRLKSQ